MNEKAKKYVDLFRRVKIAAAATVDAEGHPQARIINVMLAEDDGMYIVTSRGKPFYKQLVETGEIALAAMCPDCQSLKFTGKLRVVDKSWVDKVFAQNPGMNEVYPGESRYILDAFHIYAGHGEWFDLLHYPISRETFAYGGDTEEYNGFVIQDACIGCGACVRACEHGATRVLSLNEGTGKIEKDPCCCVGCGECVKACPTSAWTRQETKFYRVILGGRTGRQTPRTGKMFLNWATEDVVLGVLKNWQKFSAWVMDYKPEYLHGGHLIDRAGYKKFKEIILDGVELNPECLVAEDIFWHETEYRSNFNVKPVAMHHKAGPQA